MASPDRPLMLVTGASGGIGAAVVSRLAGTADVVATDLEAPGSPDAARCEALDVSDEAAWERVVGELTSDAGRPVTGLVNVAGIFARGAVHEVAPADWSACLATNVTSMYLGIRAVHAGMRDAGGGAVVNISSIAGLAAFPRSAAYVTSKWAVTGLTRSAAEDLAADGIRVNSVHPGAVDTAMSPGSVEESIPLRRKAQPQEVADMVAFLLSEQAAYCTGSEFVIDGGQSNATRR